MRKQLTLVALMLVAALAIQLRAETQVEAPAPIKKTTKIVKTKAVKKEKVKTVKKTKKAVSAKEVKKVDTKKAVKKSRVLKVTDADAGKVISVDRKQYQKISVELYRALVTQGNITAWKFGNQAGPLSEVKYKRVEPKGQLMGSAGTDKFTFEITGKGKAMVEFGHEEQLPDGTPSNRLLQPPSIQFEFDIK